MIRLAILQSGLSNSPISFTSMIPYDDFVKIYNKTLSTLESTPGLANFTLLNVFQRNNWNNDDLVPHRKAKLKDNKVYMTKYYSEFSLSKFTELKKAIDNKKIPKVMKLDARSSDSNHDIIAMSWEVGTTREKREMRAKADFSFIKRGLFKKVYSGNEPYELVDKYGNTNYVYKMINAWGDSFRANEFYNEAKASIINNGYEKVIDDKGQSIESSDETIIAYFEGSSTKESVNNSVKTTVPSKQINTSSEGVRTYEGKIESLSDNQVIVFGSNPEGRHGAGTALTAKNKFGAVYGNGRGPQGKAYALVTKNLTKGFTEPSTGITYETEGKRSVSPEQIKNNIKQLYDYATQNPKKDFLIAYMGIDSSNLNGYSNQELADMFSAFPIPSNIVFEKQFATLLKVKSSQEQLSAEEMDLRSKIALFESVIASGEAKEGDVELLKSLQAKLGSIIKSKC